MNDRKVNPEIERDQPSFEVRAESLKKRTKEFFSTYENPDGSEDRLEICLIREGHRTVLLAEEEIKRLKTELKRLNEEYMSLEAAYREQEDYESQILEGVEVCACCHEKYDEKIKQAKTEAIKEFAKRANKMITEVYNKHIFGSNDLDDAEKDAVINFSDDVTYGLANLLKEMAGETE
ncbi:MAG: hypothetical protein IKJ88_00835 [Clostridia bacterium]|nr:hypothetical protein [Clostridia bacterium]